MRLNASIEALKSAVPQLSPSDQCFANDLLYSFHNRGKLSEKQWFWVDKLAKRASEPKPERIKTKVGDLAGVLDLFAKAKRKLKRPAIVLSVADLGEIRICVAGETARVPGSLNVKDNAPWGEGNWYGRILLDGHFEASPKVETPAPLLPKLKAFAAEPAKVAAEHGRLTGRCCFCGTALTDERSTAVGYGKTCSLNWGLPYPTLAEARAAYRNICEAA
ncbi:MAG TPA: DUF6011 domain-containing protein [Hyphomicrobiales bacterium]|nr:DUF6011 domain-containing protein [Hyphomicrobiales bacterium]